MASTRGKGARSGRGGAGGRAKAGTKKGAASARAKKPVRAAKAARKPTRAAKPAAAKPSVAKRAAGGGAELAKLKARHEREKGALEKRLTDSVREIGQVRHHEARASQLERQLKERDDTIAQLRRELTDLRSRPTAPIDEDPEVQPSLALGERTTRGDLDDFDDEISLDDEDELV